MRMYNTEFIAIADVLRKVRPPLPEELTHVPFGPIDREFETGANHQWEAIRDAMAELLATTNDKFVRERWVRYVNQRVEDATIPPQIPHGGGRSI